MFSDEELEWLRGFPEVGREELIRFFTLAAADVVLVGPGRVVARLIGWSLPLGCVRCRGGGSSLMRWGLRRRPAVARVAERLGIVAGELAYYGQRVKTRTDHLRLVTRYLRWRAPGSLGLKELGEFLMARAMEYDSLTLLFRLACEYLIYVRVIRPGPVTVVERVATPSHWRTG